jgi:hypothetical protein
MKKHNLDLLSKIYSEEELEENIMLFKKLDWHTICYAQVLSENFIEKYSDKIYWELISECQNLSEEFIEKHSDKVDWDYIAIEQVLSEKFIRKHIDKIDINYLMENYHIDENVKSKIKLEVDLLKEII